MNFWEYAFRLLGMGRRKRIVAYDNHQRGIFYVPPWFFQELARGNPVKGPVLLFGLRCAEYWELDQDALVYVC